MQTKEFINVVDEINLRKNNNRLKKYNRVGKIHKKQLEFHKNGARIRWVFGGNRTGKTVCGGVEAVWYARGNHPFKKITKPTKGWVVSLTSQVQRDVAQREILRWLNPAWIDKIVVLKGDKTDPYSCVIDYIVVKSVCGGKSIIGFKNCEQGRSKFQGTSQDYIWFDEEPPKEIFDECRMRIVDTCGDMWGTMTPLMGLTWIYSDIYLKATEDPDIKYWMFEWADNPYLSQKEIKKLCESMSEEERESRQYGRFMTVSGLVYKEFNENIHVIEPFTVPKEWYDKIAIDPGLKAPLSCHFYARDDDGCVYVIDEHYVAEKPIKYHCEKILEKAKELSWPENRSGNITALIDSAANQTNLSAEKSVAQLFRENGIFVSTAVNKDKWVGIQRVKQYLKVDTTDTERYPGGKPRLFIFKTCPNLINEIKTYRWQEEKDEPVKKNDHALDELRYYIMSLREEPEKKEEETDGAYYKKLAVKKKNKRKKRLV